MLLWCAACNRETESEKCELCGQPTRDDIPCDVYWCSNCCTPIIRNPRSGDPSTCPLCGGEITYLCADIRPVFPEERSLIKAIFEKPNNLERKTIWASNNRYYIDGIARVIPQSVYAETNTDKVSEIIRRDSSGESNEVVKASIARFCRANKNRLNMLKNEAESFIAEVSADYPKENVVISFSGGKDSTVVADLVIRALGAPSTVHVFGNTTLEFPSTLEYAERYRKDNPVAIFKTAMNSEQNFYAVAKEIGPPARMMRWCCSMFKTGPITRVFNGLYRNQSILTFYGIRKCESVARSKYNRVEDDAESVKIQKQKVASPIFFWQDADVWLYILSNDLDFNEAYRLGYDRVGCWCCPNNSLRAQFLSSIYMKDLSEEWHTFLVDFAKNIGKPDPETYVDSGKWKARQGGNGLAAASSVRLEYNNCTTEEHAIVCSLSKPYSPELINYFSPIGKLAPELGRSLVHETIILDPASNMPVLSIQPFSQDEFDFAIKIKILDTAKEAELLRMSKYQVTKYNACRQCLKCESLCRYGAITINGGQYRIDTSKCRHCRQCVTDKYLSGGCLMRKYLRTKETA